MKRNRGFKRTRNLFDLAFIGKNFNFIQDFWWMGIHYTSLAQQVFQRLVHNVLRFQYPV